jgi:lipid-A-disaccharide synthase-like uncharacterized protein
MGTSPFVLAIGFLAQGFFSARMLVQWILSERARKVLSPTLFWVLSLAGSYLLCIYGWLRNDFSIILGQFISYYAYLWNLKLKGILIKLPRIVSLILLLTPVVAVIWVMQDASSFMDNFLQNKKIPIYLVIYGSIGQVIFTFRFIYQWIYSYRKGESILPKGFWILSLTGSLIICSYGCVRADLVLILGQSFGAIAYIRNLIIGYHSKNKS